MRPKKTPSLPKVLVLTTTFPRWENDSTPPFVYNLCKNLSPDFKITVLAPHHPQAKFKETMGGLKIHRFPYFFPFELQRLCYEGGILPNIKSSFLAKIQIPFLIFSELVFACRLAKKEKPKLIHAHWTVPSGTIALIIKRFFDIPVLVTAHAGDVFSKNKLIEYSNYLVIKYADFITVNSKATKKALLRPNKKCSRVSIIPMGVDAHKFKPIRRGKTRKIRNKLGLNNKKIILFVGRLAEKKGTSYLVKAMPEILKKFPDSHLLLIGYGPEEKKLKTLTKRLGLREKISFLGRIPNEELPLYYNLGDVFVAPSIQTESGDTEGLGVVLLEATACGTPVIGTDIGGISDIIKNKQTGLLVKQRNPKKIAQAVILLLENPLIKKKISSNSERKIVELFTWKVVTKKFKRVYLNLIGPA